MKIKTVNEPKTIKIDKITWKQLKLVKEISERETLDDTIWMLIKQWEKEHGSL